MEEVLDKEPQVKGGVVMDGVEVLLMDEGEFQRTLKWEQVVPKPDKREENPPKLPKIGKASTGGAMKVSLTPPGGRELKDRPVLKPRMD